MFRFLIGLVAGYGIASYLHRNDLSIRLIDLIGEGTDVVGGVVGGNGNGETIDVAPMKGMQGTQSVKRLPPEVRERIRQFMIYGFRVTGEKVRNGIKLWLENGPQQIPLAMKQVDGTYVYDPEVLDERLNRAAYAFHDELMVQP